MEGEGKQKEKVIMVSRFFPGKKHQGFKHQPIATDWIHPSSTQLHPASKGCCPQDI
jgi:hypothetical protein